MKKFKLFTIPAAALLGFSHVGLADAGGDNWSISGWINEGMTWYSDGANSDLVQSSDNGTTLGSRVTLSGNVDLPNTGLNAGFEVIFEPQSKVTPLITANQGNFGDSNDHGIRILGNSLHLSGGFGKLTFGLQSMPTDNIAVLADPSMTLWSAVSLVIRANGFSINKGSGARWGHFLNCFTAPGLGIGIDCNGIYRQGVRYDLPSFGPVSVAVGWANDDIYDIAAKYNDELGGLKTMLHLGYALNQGVNPNATTTGIYHNKARNFQAQLGLMDPGTGIFGTFAYQHETADIPAASRTGPGVKLSDKTHAWWTKVGVKRAFNSLGDTAISFQYGNYSDQYGYMQAQNGVTGSKVKRMGFAVDQYFGSRLIIYGAWERLGLDVEGSANAKARYGSADDLHIFSTGLTFFF